MLLSPLVRPPFSNLLHPLLTLSPALTPALLRPQDPKAGKSTVHVVKVKVRSSF
jgi:hypothetical protein